MLQAAAAVTPRVLALAALLAVGTRTLCQGVDGHYGTTGGYRYPRLDKFLHDRMGLDNRSGPPGLAARTAISTTTTTTVASVAAPEDEDYGGGDDEDDEEEDEEMARESIRLRHLNRKENGDNDLFDKVIIIPHSTYALLYRIHDVCTIISYCSDTKMSYMDV